MPLQITKGIKAGAVRAVVYGTEGIGKTTLASKIRGSIIVDTEDGSSQLDVARTLALDWRSIEAAARELVETDHGFEAVIFDSADWVEKSLSVHLLKQKGKKSIEDFGFGKGYTMLQEEFSNFLTQTDKLIARGIHVVFVAHSTVSRISPPDQTDGFDRYELKLSKRVAPILKEWADLVLFCNYKLQIVEGNDGKIKAQGGRERVMYATRTAAWDAKNRFGLPDEMPMEFSQIAHVFENAAPRVVSAPPAITPVEKTTTYAVNAPTPAPVNAQLATEKQRSIIEGYKQASLGAVEIEAALESANAVGIDELSEMEAEALIGVLRSVATFVLPEDFTEWLRENADKVNAYLTSIKWLPEGQNWNDLLIDKKKQLFDKADKFAKAAGIPPYQNAAA